MTRTSPNGDGGSKDEGIQEQQTLVAAPTPRPDNAAAQQQTSDDRAPLQAVSAEAHALEPPADDDPAVAAQGACQRRMVPVDELVAAVEAMDLKSYQKKHWPAIKQSLAKQQAYHQEFWQEAHPGRPLSEAPPLELPNVLAMPKYRGPQDDAAFGFVGPDAAAMRGGAGIMNLCGWWLMLQDLADVREELPFLPQT